MTLGEGYVPQPYVAWVDFWIYGKGGGVESLTLNEGRPVRLMGFEHRLTSETYTEWKLDLFDPEWDKVTNLLRSVISSGVNKHGAFQYYYTGPNKEQTLHSQLFNAMIMAATPTIGTHGLTLSIKGHGMEFMGHITHKTDAPAKPDGTGKRISTIVREIIKEHETDKVPWKIGHIRETARVMANVHHEKTEAVEAVFQQRNMSHMQYIHNVLIPYAVSTSRKEGDYVFIAEDKGDHIKCSFQPRMDYNKGHIRTFQFMWGDKNSEVISFSPEVNSNSYLTITGGSDVKINVSNQTALAVKEVMVNAQETQQSEGEGTSGRSIIEASLNTDVAEIQLTNRWLTAWGANQKATLVIQGDPRVKPQMNIKVIVWMPGRVPHEFSGIWKVNDVTHTIGPGKFETSLALVRLYAPLGGGD